MFKKLGKNLDKALGNLSHLNSSIPEKKKAKENEYKDAVHVLTGRAAYPGQAEKEDAILASLEVPLSSLEEQSVVPVVDTDLRAALGFRSSDAGK